MSEFIEFVRRKLGAFAVKVLIHRLHGHETKELYCDPALGEPTRYAIKQVVRELKAAAKEFVERSRDPAFLGMVQQAMAQEDETMRKRTRRTVAAKG